MQSMLPLEPHKGTSYDRRHHYLCRALFRNQLHGQQRCQLCVPCCRMSNTEAHHMTGGST